MSRRVSSILWVYTRRTDAFHTSLDKSVQLRYWWCVNHAGPSVKRIVCILEYLLMHASFPYPVPRVEEVYVYPGVITEYDIEENVEIVKLRCDRCSLAEVVALFPKKQDTGLDYTTMQRVLLRHNATLVYPAGLPKNAVKMIRYGVARTLLSQTKSHVDAEIILEQMKDTVLVSLSEVEKNCMPVF